MTTRKSTRGKPLGKESLLEAYRIMKTIRAFETRVGQEFEKGTVPGFTHLYSGQEAIATSVCMNLKDSDYIGSTHRGHGHSIAKGCDVKAMFAELMGKATGLCNGKGGSMHVADLGKGMLGANGIVGGSAPLCVGAALTAKNRGTDGVAVSFAGDGGANEGVVFESLNLAVVLQLPVLFMVENNGYGEATGYRYAVGCGDIAARTGAFGMPSEKVDGQDFFAMFEAVKKAVKHARDGGGPSAIEAMTTRFGGHFVGDPQLYRAKGEVEQQQRDMDCIKLFVDRVVSEKWVTRKALAQIDAEVDTLIDEAVEEALAAPYPTADQLHTNVYKTY